MLSIHRLQINLSIYHCVILYMAISIVSRFWDFVADFLITMAITIVSRFWDLVADFLNFLTTMAISIVSRFWDFVADFLNFLITVLNTHEAKHWNLSWFTIWSHYHWGLEIVVQVQPQNCYPKNMANNLQYADLKVVIQPLEDVNVTHLKVLNHIFSLDWCQVLKCTVC